MSVIKMSKTYQGSLYPKLFGHRQKKFSDVYESADQFLSDYNNVGIKKTITDESATTLFYLLYANYGNSRIAASDNTRFKYKLFSLIFQYGPTWEKKLEIQEKFRNMSEEELIKGSRQIYNSAINPSTSPGTSTTDELEFIQSQNVTHNMKGKFDAYTYLWDMLQTDVTQLFLNQFKVLFLKIGEPDIGISYISDEEENYQIDGEEI